MVCLSMLTNSLRHHARGTESLLFQSYSAARSLVTRQFATAQAVAPKTGTEGTAYSELTVGTLIPQLHKGIAMS